MIQAFQNAWDWFADYQGTGCYHILYLICVLVLWRSEAVPAKWRRMFPDLSLVLAVLYFFPLTAAIMIRLVGISVYWRVLWVFPLPFLLAFTAASGKKEGRRPAWRELLYVAAVLAILVLSGKNLYLNHAFVKAENSQKLMKETVMIANALEADRTGERIIRAAMPTEISWEIRQYDAQIYLPYGRWSVGSEEQFELWEAMQQNPADVGRLCKALRDCACNYVVRTQESGLAEEMEQAGFLLVDTVGSYQIYRDSLLTEENMGDE